MTERQAQLIDNATERSVIVLRATGQDASSWWFGLRLKPKKVEVSHVVG